MLFNEIKVLSERTILFYFGKEITQETHRKIQLSKQLLDEHPIPGVTEVIAGYTNICVHFDPLQISKVIDNIEKIPIVDKVILLVEERIASMQLNTTLDSRIIEIPVVYGGKYGPDLQYVAQQNGLTSEQVIEIHTAGEYLVYMLGFAPGFPFLGGLDARIATPRRETPRLKIEAGSVGIAGQQTGVYPLETPGGWQIIGKAMIDLFLPEQTPPTLLRAGDRVKFVAVKEEAK